MVEFLICLLFFYVKKLQKGSIIVYANPDKYVSVEEISGMNMLYKELSSKFDF